MKKQELTFINQSVFLNVDDDSIACIDLTQASLWQSYYIGHK
jgi:hypothetical protein